MLARQMPEQMFEIGCVLIWQVADGGRVVFAKNAAEPIAPNSGIGKAKPCLYKDAADLNALCQVQVSDRLVNNRIVIAPALQCMCMKARMDRRRVGKKRNIQQRQHARVEFHIFQLPEALWNRALCDDG